MKKFGVIAILAFSLTILFLGSGSLSIVFAAEQNGEVVYALGSGLFYQKGGDPATHSGGLGPIFMVTFDSLVFLDMDTLEPHPALAESWKIAPDWSYIDFNLREGVKFHNGETVTEEDVKYSIETYLRPELKWTMGAGYRRDIKSIEVAAKNKIRINMNNPQPNLFLDLCWGVGIFPKKYREKVGDNAFADKPVGTGPFRWVDYKQDVYFKVEALENQKLNSAF